MTHILSNTTESFCRSVSESVFVYVSVCLHIGVCVCACVSVVVSVAGCLWVTLSVSGSVARGGAGGAGATARAQRAQGGISLKGLVAHMTGQNKKAERVAD